MSTELGDVSAFLDAYLERCVRPAALRSIRSVRSQITILKEHLGHLPLSALEEPDEINRFKTNSDYAEDVEIASLHRVLERYARPSTGEWRKRPRSSASLRSTGSVFG